jgi:hypothetical protein
LTYTKTTWTDNTTPLSATNMNNLETQYDEAMADATAKFLDVTSSAPNPQTVANPVTFDSSVSINNPNPTINLDSTSGDTSIAMYAPGVANPKLSIGWHVSNDNRFISVNDGTNWHEMDIDASGNWIFPSNITAAGSITSPNPTFVGSQIFTSSGTFTVPTGVKRIFVQAWGAGGGGAQGAYNQQYGTCFGGGGGGGGGYAEGWIEVSAGQQITVTVGAGGAPGSGANGTQLNLGGTGGTSSFGSYVQATGGTGGYQSEAGTGQPLNATGGSGGLGNLGTYGATGNNGGGAGSNTTNGQNGGGGATSMAGPGGAGSTSMSTAGGNGYAPGGGGGGGYANPYTSVTAGGSGARGEVRVYY